jgi:hypothetical protein
MLVNFNNFFVVQNPRFELKLQKLIYRKHKHFIVVFQTFQSIFLNIFSALISRNKFKNKIIKFHFTVLSIAKIRENILYRILEDLIREKYKK